MERLRSCLISKALPLFLSLSRLPFVTFPYQFTTDLEALCIVCYYFFLSFITFFRKFLVCSHHHCHRYSSLFVTRIRQARQHYILRKKKYINDLCAQSRTVDESDVSHSLGGGETELALDFPRGVGRTCAFTRNLFFYIYKNLYTREPLCQKTKRKEEKKEIQKNAQQIFIDQRAGCTSARQRRKEKPTGPSRKLKNDEFL